MPYKNIKGLPTEIPASMEWLKDNGSKKAPNLSNRFVNPNAPLPTISAVRISISHVEKNNSSSGHSGLGMLVPYVVQWCMDTGKTFVVHTYYKGSQCIGHNIAIVKS